MQRYLDIISPYGPIVFGIASIVVAVCAVIVSRAQSKTALAQWNLAKCKFQFDLFDRRLQIKNAIFGLGASVVMPGRITPEAWIKFIDDAFNCRFLFPDEVAIWIKEIFDQGWQLLRLEIEENRLTKLERQSTEEEAGILSDLCKKQEEPHRFILALGNEVDRRLDPYLRLETA